MSKSLSSIIKHKKTLFFVFLFVVASCTVLPHTILADTSSDLRANLLGRTPDNAENIVWGITDIVKGTEVSLARFVNLGAYRISAYSNLLLSYVLSSILSSPITTDANFTTIWTQIKNLANMLVVLGFVLIGVATALRIREYEAKKLLLPLIVVALLINFSGLLCGLIIDASNLITTGLGIGGAGGNMGTLMLSKLEFASYNYLTENMAQNNTGNFLAGSILFATIFLGVAFTFLYLSVLLIARYVILIMLFILSPLAFVLWVYPASKHLWTEWWNNFLKWCFVGVFGALVLMLTATIADKTITPNLPADQLIINCVIILGFLYVGFKMTSKSTGIAAMAGKAIMGLAAGGAGYAMGAIAGGAKGGGKMLNKLSGGAFSADAQKIKSGYGRTLERLGLRDRGITASGNSKQVEEKASLMSKEYAAAKATGDKGTMNRIQKQARTGRGMEGAAAMKVVTEAKDLHDTFAERDAKGNVIRDPVTGKTKMDLSDAGKRLSYAESAGATGTQKVAENLNPMLATHNKVTMDKLMAPVAQGGKGLTPAAAQQTAIAEAVRKTAPSDAAKWDSSVISNPEVFTHISKSQLIEGGKRGSPEWVDAAKKFKRVRDAHGNVAPAALQTKEYQALLKHVSTNYGAGSSQGTNAGQLLNEIETNDIFQ